MSEFRRFAREQFGCRVLSIFIGPSNYPEVFQLGGFSWRRWESPFYGRKEDHLRPRTNYRNYLARICPWEQRGNADCAPSFSKSPRAACGPPGSSLPRDKKKKTPKNIMLKRHSRRSPGAVAGFFIRILPSIQSRPWLVKLLLRSRTCGGSGEMACVYFS